MNKILQDHKSFFRNFSHKNFFTPKFSLDFIFLCLLRGGLVIKVDALHVQSDNDHGPLP